MGLSNKDGDWTINKLGWLKSIKQMDKAQVAFTRQHVLRKPRDGIFLVPSQWLNRRFLQVLDLRVFPTFNTTWNGGGTVVEPQQILINALGGAVACLFDDLCSGGVRAWNYI